MQGKGSEVEAAFGKLGKVCQYLSGVTHLIQRVK
jgi:hypothetical protein